MRNHAPPFAGHIPALDGIRGVAILLVMVSHFTIITPSGTVEAIVSKVLRTGGVTGVELFFVLSGFLITGILYDSKGGPHFFRNFYARRALRIFPLYYGFLVALFVVGPLLVRGPLSAEYQALLQRQGWYWTYLVNVLIAVTGTQAAAPMATHHFWSLAVEEQFYLVWPLLVWTFERRALMTICAGICAGALALRIAMYAAGAPHIAVAVLTPTRIDALAVGALIALRARGPGGFAGLPRWAWGVVAGTLAVLVPIFVAQDGGEDGVWLATIGYSALALLFGAALVIAVTAPANSLRHRAFANPPIRALGRYSYAMYVFHLPMMAALTSRGIVGPERLPAIWGSQMPAQVVLLIVLSGASLALGWLSWHLYEKHFLQLKELFPYRAARASTPQEEAMRREGDAFAAP